ncbi:MAG TPA: Calx-beta domain-containing protein [Labilithrix sp.]|nr:Calx-beta domain-containing protein [Labilithrix sp.]
MRRLALGPVLVALGFAQSLALPGCGNSASPIPAPDAGTDVVGAGGAVDDDGGTQDVDASLSPPGAVVVTPSSTMTSEAAGTATVAVKLEAAPTADVVISVTSDTPTEGVASVASLTFTPANWATEQTITVTGVDDDVADGDKTYKLVLGPAESADARYSGLAIPPVTMTNVDDEEFGVSVGVPSGNTTEAGGKATFEVVLRSEPSADVTISVTSSNTSEGTVSVSQLVFTPANWSTAQTVTVTGVDDDVDDGDVAYSVALGPAVSTDAQYNDLAIAAVPITNLDDDTAGVLVGQVSSSTTTEAGGEATFTVALSSKPSADVTISVTSSNTSEGTVAPAELVFTPDDWKTAQTVTVTGVKDDVDDGDVAYAVDLSVASTDALYSGIEVPSVNLTNVDKDTAGIVVSPISGETSESGVARTFTVVLASKPTANVTVHFESNNPAEGVTDKTSLVFTPGDWDTPQYVEVTGVNDDLPDGDVDYGVAFTATTSADPKYAGLIPATVAITNIDDD